MHMLHLILKITYSVVRTGKQNAAKNVLLATKVHNFCELHNSLWQEQARKEMASSVSNSAVISNIRPIFIA